MSTATREAQPSSSTTAMGLLAQGVPLSLLLDLAMGPHSAELLDAERVPAQRPAS